MGVVKRPQEVKEGLLVHHLRRAGNVVVSLFERLIGLSGRAEQGFQSRAVVGTHRWAAMTPLMGQALGGVGEPAQIEAEGAIAAQAHDPLHRLEMGRLAVGGQPHHLVFVAVVRKAEELGDRGVEGAEGVWKEHLAIDADAGAGAMAPGGAGEITEAIHRHHRRLREGRGVEGRRQMGTVVVDEVQPGAQRLIRKCSGQVVGQGGTFALDPPLLNQEARIRAMAEGVGELAPAMG